MGGYLANHIPIVAAKTVGCPALGWALRQRALQLTRMNHRRPCSSRSQAALA
jgi:hypothetical protein